MYVIGCPRRRRKREQGIGTRVGKCDPCGRLPPSCPPNVALNTDVRSRAARVRGATYDSGAASSAQAGPGRDGMVHRDLPGHPDLPTRSQQRCAAGEPILHPAGPQRAGRPGRPGPLADVAPLEGATSAVCGCGSVVSRPGRDDASPASGNGITAGASRDAGGGRHRRRGSASHLPVADVGPRWDQ